MSGGVRNVSGGVRDVSDGVWNVYDGVRDVDDGFPKATVAYTLTGEYDCRAYRR